MVCCGSDQTALDDGGDAGGEGAAPLPPPNPPPPAPPPPPSADGGGDAADAATDADAAVIPDGGVPPNPGSVTCGSTSCAVATSFCCVAPDGGATCQTSGGTCTALGGAKHECDEAADCPATQVCCYELDALTSTFSTACHVDCAGGGGLRDQACKQTAECLDGTCAVHACDGGATIEACKPFPGVCP